MSKNRVEAFSDGTLAILITIMVLELRPPHGVQLADLRPLLPVFLSYILSFLYLGIYWNNHHHMLHAVKKIDGVSMWANSHLLFWLSLVPFTTAYIGEHPMERLPLILYGVVLLMSGVAYWILQELLIKANPNSTLSRAVVHDFKGRSSPPLYVTGIVFSLLDLPILAYAIYIGVAFMWLLPDRRIERQMDRDEADHLEG